MGRGPIPMRRPKLPFLESITDTSTFGISPSFLGLSQSSGHVTHVLLTRSRLCPRASPGSSLHLHVLSTPPAFVLSQDQTLREESVMDCLGPIHNGPNHDGVLLFLTRYHDSVAQVLPIAGRTWTHTETA